MLVSRGNGKPCIGKDTFIINITSAHNCTSRELGLCQVVANRCYAFRCELYRPNTRKYRDAQTVQWDSMSAQEIAIGILDKAERLKTGPRIKYLRAQEAGDFRNQADVEKLSWIAHVLGNRGIKTYTYTARSDLDFSGVSEYLTVNGSGFKAHNEYRAVKGLPSKKDAKGYKIPKGTICPNVAKCKLCKVRGGKTILTKLR